MEIGGYTLRDVVGDGRTGRVYRASRAGDGAAVAFRQIKPALAREPGVAEAVAALASATAELRDPAAVPIAEVIERDGAICVVEGWLDGPTLAQRLEEGQLPAAEVVELGSRLAAALQDIHGLGLVHGDISPNNIYLTPNGPRLCGIGVAVATNRRTVGRSMFGDPYDAPEVQGGKAPTIASDLFALAAALQHALHGEVLWHGGSDAETPLELALSEAKAASPADRPASAEILKNALLAAAPAARPAAPPKRPEPVERPAPRRARAPRQDGVEPEAPGKASLPDWWPKAAAGIGGAVVLLLVGKGVLGMLPDVPGGMVAVEAGSTPVGGGGHELDERPGYDWSHPRFFLDRAEVTVGEYRECVDGGECRLPVGRDGLTLPAEDVPMVGVTWLEANTYCAWRGKRLPTENEWEAAARSFGGTWPWGESAPDCGRAHYGAGPEGACPDAAMAPRPGGAAEPADLAGNVWEFTDSDYTLRRGSGSGGRSSGGSSLLKTIKGGAFSSAPGELRSAARMGVPLDHWAGDVGFRCAQDAG